MADKPEAPTTQEIEDAIVEWISEGRPLREFCRQPGMPSFKTVYNWMDKDDAFSTRVARAREIGFAAIAEETMDIADNSENDYMEREDKQGNVRRMFDSEHVQRSKLRIETRMKLLACWDPRRYGNKVTVEPGISAQQLLADLDEARRRSHAD